MDKYISIFILLAFGAISTFGNPISNSTNATISAPASTPKPTNLRQEVDGGDVDEAIEGFSQVAGPIAQIISGTLSGNIGQLFSGVTGTVTDQEAQPGVGQILTGVSIPLTSIFKGSIAAGQKYFNLTTPNPLGAEEGGSPTPLPVGANGVVLTPEQQKQQLALQQQQKQQIQQVGVPLNQGVAVVAAPAPFPPVPVVAATTPTSEDDDEDEFENDILNKNVIKV